MTAPIIIPDFTGITHGRKPPYGQVRLNRNHPLAHGLVGCWLFNEKANVTSFNLCSLAPGFLVNGAVFTQTGASFTTDNDSFLSDLDGGFIVGGQLSIIFGYKTTVAPPTYPYFLQCNLYTNFSGYWVATNSLQIRGAGGYLVLDSSINMMDYSYHNIAVTLDDSNINAELYVDGQFQDSDVTDINPSSLSGNKIYIGGRQDGTTRYSAGEWNYCYIYDRILTSTEMASLHADPYQIFEPVISLPIVFGVSAVGGNAPTGTFYGPLYGPFRGPI